MGYPRAEAGLLALAVLALLTALLLPAQDWFVAETRLPAAGVALVWMLWRGVAYARAHAHYRAWTHTPAWEVEAHALDQYHP